MLTWHEAPSKPPPLMMLPAEGLDYISGTNIIIGTSKNPSSTTDWNLVAYFLVIFRSCPKEGNNIQSKAVLGSYKPFQAHLQEQMGLSTSHRSDTRTTLLTNRVNICVSPNAGLQELFTAGQVQSNWVKRRSSHKPNWLNWARLMRSKMHYIGVFRLESFIEWIAFTVMYWAALFSNY